MDFPKDLLYTQDHEWLRIEGDIATVGITEFATRELGDIVYVEIETVGEELKEQEVFGTIEAVKTVSDLFLPIAGTVTEVNPLLEEQPEIVNQDPYGDGWLIKMQVVGSIEEAGLLDTEAYNASLS